MWNIPLEHLWDVVDVGLPLFFAPIGVMILVCILIQKQVLIMIMKIHDHISHMVMNIEVEETSDNSSGDENPHEAKYICNWYPTVFHSSKDPFRDIPIRELFEMVYNNITYQSENISHLNLGDKEAYIKSIFHRFFWI